MHTILRDRFQEKQSELRAMLSRIDDKTTKLTDAESQQLNDLSTEVAALKDELAIVDPDDQLYKAMNSKKLADDKAFLNQLGAPGAGAGAADGNHAALRFTKEQLASLQRGALERQVTTKAAVSSATAGMAAVADYDVSTFPFLRDKQRILDLIPQERTEAPAVHFFQGTTAAAAAGPVAEGTAKPESAPVWTEATATVRKLAHYTRVNDEVIADFSSFMDVIGTEMLAGLIDEENQQLLTGSGVAPNLTGLTIDANVLTVGSVGTDLDAIADAWRALRTGAAHCDPDVVVMHPNDWYSGGFLLAKETGGAYLLGSPVSATKPMLWGVPVVVSEAMTENTAMVANLKVACTAYVRQPPTVEVAPYGGGTTEFIANQTLIRAEERLALAIHHPKAVCLVTAV